MLILAAGAMGNPPLLMRSRPLLPGLSGRVGKHLGVNGDHIAAVEYDEKKVRDVLGLPGYGQFYKGNHITTMSYDWWKGRPDGTRFTLQEIFLSNLAHTLYDDGRAPSSEPTWWGLQKKQALSTFNNHIEILAMVEDTHDGEFLAPPPTGSHIRPNAGPVGIGPFTYQLSDQSVAVREAANAAIKSVVERNGLARSRSRPTTASAPPIRWAAAGWPTRRTSAWSTTATRCSATRACSAWTPRRSRRRWGSTRRSRSRRWPSAPASS